MHPRAIDAKRETWRTLADRGSARDLTLDYYEALSIAAAQEIMALLNEIEKLQDRLRREMAAREKDA